MTNKVKCATCSLLALLLVTTAAAQKYTVTALGALPGFTSSYADDNNKTPQGRISPIAVASLRRNAVLPALRHGRPPPMGKNRIKPNYRRRVLRLPDLDHCKAAVLNSLGSPASRRVYEYAID